MRVWAPLASRVDLVTPSGTQPMEAGEGGWHVAGIALAPGADYGFSLDGGPRRPDPRSPWQPEGIAGWSRTVDHAAFTWSDGGWDAGEWHRAGVLYELHVGTFTAEGTFDAAVERLDHLVGLGVAAVELMPVAEFPGRRGWGYDGVDLFAPLSAYGGPEGLKRLVDACHGRGIAVVLDVVYNHLGPAGNHLGEFGPYFTDRYATPWGEAVNLDGADSDEVRAFFVDNALMWLRDYHFDGLRVDAVHALIDTSAVHLLEEIATSVAGLESEVGRRLMVIAESDLNDPRLLWPRERGGFGLAAQWSDDFHHALHAVLTDERDGYYADFGTVAQLAKAVEDAFVYDGAVSPHRRRRHGRPATGIERWRFFGFLQNHDQIGNRATGERSSHLLDVPGLRIAAGLVLLAPFAPMLFQGEEWGASTPFQYFTDHDDPDLGRAVSDGRCREFAAFGWQPEDLPDPQDPATFERSRLRWDEVSTDPHASLLGWHRDLIALRTRLGPCAGATARSEEAGDSRWLAIDRGDALVVANLGFVPVCIPAGEGMVALASVAGVQLQAGTLVLPPGLAVVLREGDTCDD